MNLVPKVALIIVLVLVGVAKGLCQSVTLAWDPSPDPDVVGYNIYYGVESQTYTNFVAAGQATSVTISNLSLGWIYYFAATTIDTIGLESEFSPEISYSVGSLPCDIKVSNLVQAYDGT